MEKIERRKWNLGRDSFTGSDNDQADKYPYKSLAAQMGRQGCGAPLKDAAGKIRSKVFGNVDTATGTTHYIDIQHTL